MDEEKLIEKIKYGNLTEDDWEQIKTEDFNVVESLLTNTHIDGYCTGYEDGCLETAEDECCECCCRCNDKK